MLTWSQQVLPPHCSRNRSFSPCFTLWSSSVATLWELAAAEVHRRETEAEEEDEEAGGRETTVAERSVFVLGSKAGVSSSPSGATVRLFCQLTALRPPLLLCRGKLHCCSNASTGQCRVCRSWRRTSLNWPAFCKQSYSVNRGWWNALTAGSKWLLRGDWGEAGAGADGGSV